MIISDHRTRQFLRRDLIGGEKYEKKSNIHVKKWAKIAAAAVLIPEEMREHFPRRLYTV